MTEKVPSESRVQSPSLIFSKFGRLLVGKHVEHGAIDLMYGCPTMLVIDGNDISDEEVPYEVAARTSEKIREMLGHTDITDVLPREHQLDAALQTVFERWDPNYWTEERLSDARRALEDISAMKDFSLEVSFLI